MAVAFAASAIYVSHRLYRTAYSRESALYTLDGFQTQYARGIYAGRFLFRDILAWLAAGPFGGRLHEARGALNFVFLTVLNTAFLVVASGRRIPGEAALALVFALDLFCIMALSVNSNPYTIPTTALAYLAIACFSVTRASARSVAFGAGLATFATAVVAHEVALLAASTATGFALIHAETDREAAWKVLLIVSVAVGAYVAPRLAIDALTLRNTYHTYMLDRNLGNPYAVLQVTAVLSALATLIAPARHRLADPSCLPFTLLIATLVLYLPYVTFVGNFLEVRMFIIYVPAALILFGTAIERTPSTSESVPH